MTEVTYFMGRKAKQGKPWFPEIISTDQYRKLRVGFDLDGVGYNFGDSVQRYLEMTGRGDLWKSGPTPKPFWDFYKDWGWTGNQFLELCNEGADAGVIFTGPVRPNFVETVRAVKRLGHTVVIITDRGFGTTPEVSQNHTKDWLFKHDIPYDELYFSPDKTISPTDIFVEDKWENYQNLMNAGIPTYLITRAWNEDHATPNRISDISEYLAKVIDKSFHIG